MKKSIRIAGIICLMTLPGLLCAQKSKEKTAVGDLRVEYLKDPLGIGVTSPRFFWKMSSNEQNQKQLAYQVIVASSPDLLKKAKGDLWNSGKVDSDQSIHVEYRGSQLNSRDRCWWKVRIWDRDGKASGWSQPSRFEVGLLSPDDWKAEWIRTSIEFDSYSYPSPMFRKEFAAKIKIRSARAYISCLGLYELEINGEKVGDGLLTPGFTSYDKRVQYQAYDISHMIRKGENAVGISLGNGWYRNFRAYPNEAPDLAERDLQHMHVIAQIEITYMDGTREVIGTDKNWHSSTGPVLSSSIYNGESYDARLEQEGWSLPGFDDDKWSGVVLSDIGKDLLVSSSSPPIRVIGEIEPVEVIYTPGGDTLLDMGQNMAGWCRLQVKAARGSTIVLKHAEILDKEGNFYTENLRTAKQTDTYICKGDGSLEIYEPRFTYHGFRYVKISGYPGEINTGLLRGIVIHSDLERNGHFQCNDSLVNKLYSNILWTQKSNFMDIPTDCPQRDERMGWTGDGMYFSPTASFNYLTPSFYGKWLKDLAADQDESGLVYVAVPKKLNSGGAFGWCDATVMLPWILYRTYGDIRILEEQYESMKGWVDYQFRKSGELSNLEWQGFGDWLAFGGNHDAHYSPGEPTDLDMMGTVYFFQSARTMAQIAKLLGKEADARKYNDLTEKASTIFKHEFVTASGRLTSNTQTAFALPLSFGVIQKGLEGAVAQRLAGNVKKFGHITTGLLGTREISHALTDHGYTESAYHLLFREEYPSWLYMIRMGGTTVWERWDAMKPDSSFQTPHMNSFNHPTLGTVGDWLYRKVAGIDADPIVPGFKDIVIKPHPGGKMKEVNASYESLYGLIRSAWKIEDGRFRMEVGIPPNTRAVIQVPSTGGKLLVNGKELANPEKLGLTQTGYHFLVHEVGSGSYILESEYSLEKISSGIMGASGISKDWQ